MEKTKLTIELNQLPDNRYHWRVFDIGIGKGIVNIEVDRENAVSQISNAVLELLEGTD